jgi:threonine dehydrogenase-like Zn-dependent dehydrogenase
VSERESGTCGWRAVDCVGFEAKGQGGVEQLAIVLNQLMDVTRAAGAIGILGMYVTDDPGSKDAAARQGSLSLRFGLGWAKSHSVFTGQAPVMKYNRALMMAESYRAYQLTKRLIITFMFDADGLSCGEHAYSDGPITAKDLTPVEDQYLPDLFKVA